MKKVIMGIVSLMFILGMVGCAPAPTGVVEPTKAAVAEPAATQPVVEATKPVEKTAFAIGEVVKTSNGATIIISNLKKSKGGEYESIKAGNELVLVTVTIKNTGTEILSYNPYDYKMQNSQGQILDGTFSSINTNTALGSGNLAVGGNITGTLIFEQPKDDKALTLIYTGNMFSTEGITFKLN